MVMRWLLAVVIVTTPIAPAQAKKWPSSAWFDIDEGTDFCVASSTYSFEGRSDVKLALLLSEEGIPVLSLNSLDWSAKDGAEYPGITYELNGFVHSDAVDENGKLLVTTKGYTHDGIYKGFLRAFSKEFVDDFAKGESLVVTSGKTIITHVNLHSSGTAIQTLRQCAAHVKRSNDAKRAEKAKWDYIEKDPFAKAAEPASKKRNVEVHTRSITPFVSVADYPAAALAEKRSGATQYRLTVGRDGRAEACATIVSSGHADLDKQTCSWAMRRARFSPALDDSGNPIQATWDGIMDWKLPD